MKKPIKLSLRSFVNKRMENLSEVYFNAIFKMALSMHYDIPTAEDCAQDVIINVATKCDNWEGMNDTERRAYLYRATVNTMKNKLKKMERELPEGLSEDPALQNVVYEEKYEMFRGKYGFGEEMDAYLDRLKERDINLLIKKFVEGKTYKVIANEVGDEEDTVAKRVRRAIAKVEGYMLDEEVSKNEK